MLSVPVPDELKREMARHKETKWVEVARKALWDRVKALDKLDEIMAKSRLTEADVVKHSRIVNKRVWERHKRALGI